MAERDAFFRGDVAYALAASPSPPVLIGDFNCVLRPQDTEANYHQKRSPPLAALVADSHLTDAFLHLHPDGPPSFTFGRRSSAAARLDRAYLSPVFTGHLLAASHHPSLSDHAALFVTLAGSLQSSPPTQKPFSYWKLNTSLLSDEDFLPTFTVMWNNLLAGRPLGACPAEWWESSGKPACRDFCIRFSKLAAHRRREKVAFLHVALRVAIAGGHWNEVASIRKELAIHARYRLTGKAVRARVAATAAMDLQEAAEGAGVAKGPLRLSAAGRILTDPVEVEEEVTRYFGALFQGRHTATAGRPEPFDSGRPFQPNFDLLPEFLQDMPTLDQAQRDLLDLPVNIPDLEVAAAVAATGRAPGLDGLPYEFYRVVLPVIGVQLAEALNIMLERGLLTPSLRRGAVRLLPKVPGAPAASQLRPITLLTCDYKLLTKVYVRRLIPLLPTILTTAQLCSVPGRSIFDGCTALLSAVESCYRRRRPGFLLNLDFFHAFDRVCMPYVDRVLEAMGFGDGFREVVRTLHRGATAVFLLDDLSREILVEFSVRQGDPLAALLFIIQIEPFLRVLCRLLPGLTVGEVKEMVEAYMDDVDAVGEKLADLILIDKVTERFEAVSGQILNRNRKSAVLGLGTWAGRQDWPLPWLHAPPTLKVFGVTFGPSLAASITASWAACQKGVQNAMNLWSGKRLPTLRLRRDALETFIFS